MKVIIAGTRTFTDVRIVRYALLESGFMPTEIVCGCASGVDAIGARIADDMDIPVMRFLPNWQDEGKRAGPLRNKRMAAYADALVLVWDGESRGSSSMKREAKRAGIHIYEWIISDNNQRRKRQ